MKRLILFVLISGVLFLRGISSANYDPKMLNNFPVISDSGVHPDSFGYTWVDNDNGGSPVFNWVDITNRGIRVQGLGDDNSVGPFQLGFQFPYYRYTVDHIQSLGSNGYISFSQSNALFAQPFSSIPSDSTPADLVAPLAGDLDFYDSSLVRPHSCWFWTNCIDSAVVSWINISEWNVPSTPDSTHTFQLIICAYDSSITFQYGENHGRFLNNNDTPDDVIGIANVNKHIGLQYLRNNAPSNHLWHDGLAVRFHAEPNPNYQIHDFGVVDGFHEGSGADFIPLNQPYEVIGIYKNFGNQTESNVKATIKIQRGTTIVLMDTVLIPSLAPAEIVNITFNRRFTPTTIATYKVTFNSLMTGDQNNSNNSKICELDCYQLPQDLKYTGNTPSTGKSWNTDNSGFGIDIQVPEVIRFNNASVYISSVTAPGPEYLWIVASNSQGEPDFDNILAGDTVQISLSDTGWIESTFPELTIPANQRFFVVSIAAFSNTFFHGVDQISPFSYRGWEYTSGLAPDRDRNFEDIMIKVYCESGIPPLPGNIAGIVTEPNSNPIEGVVDSLFTGVHILAGIDTTDMAGNYSFTVEPGAYRVKFVKQNFRDTTVTDIAVYSEQTTFVNVQMNRLTICHYIPGDINGDGIVNALDISFAVNFFCGGSNPDFCICGAHGPLYVAGDVNGSCSFNCIDITYMILYFRQQRQLLSCIDCPPR